MKINQFLKINAVAIAAVMFTGALMSFKVIEKKGKAVAQTFYYISNDMTANAFRDVSHWSTSTIPTDCSPEEPVRPCKVTVPDGSSLSAVLGSKTNSEVLAISEGYRPEP